MMGIRVNVVVLIAGDRGTGKTTALTGNAEKGITGILPMYSKRDPGKKILVIDTFDNPIWRHYQGITIQELPTWTAGPRRIWHSDLWELFEAISQYCFNTVLVFEDATKFIDTRLDRNSRKFVLDSKQKNLDIYFIFHSLSVIPRDLTRISDIVILFKTKETWDNNLKAKYSTADMEKAFYQVQKAKSWYYNLAVRISG